MLLRRKLVPACAIALVLLPGIATFAALPQAEDADKEKVLQRLDRGAANFHSTSAEFVFDTETPDPVPDSDIQKGSVYYQRDSKTFKMAAHINEANKRPVTRVYTFSNGLLTFFDKLTDQVTRFSKAGKFEGYLLLGFGASGKELAEKWDIKYLGPETIDSVQTEKLELVAKDPEMRKNLNKVTIWVDPERAVSLRQRFDESQGVYRICSYAQFRTNQALPGDAFSFKTDPNTTYVNR